MLSLYVCNVQFRGEMVTYCLVMASLAVMRKHYLDSDSALKNVLGVFD